MKYLFLILFSVNAFAGFVAGSKMNECNRTDYTDPTTCQKQENETCYKVPNDSGECGIYKFKDIYGGQMKNVEECEGQNACGDILTSKQCGENEKAFINQNYTSVYCMEKVGKEIAIDTALQTQKQNERNQTAQYEAGVSKALAAMNCGRRVMAVMLVRNSTKNLTTEQVSQMVETYAKPKDLLETGSLTTAKELINSLQVDGTLVTEADKTALSNEIDKCKP